MKKEDKELLLKDLCARLPYGVKVEHLLHSPNNPSDLFAIDVDKQLLYCDHKGREEWYKVEYVKPYLRPMISMTEEEKEELNSLCYHNIDVQDGMLCGYICAGEMNDVIDWLNAHHFDYRGLIDKGLSIAVNESNNPYND